MHSVTSHSAHPDTPPHHNTSQSTTESTTQPTFAHTTPTSATTRTIPNPPTRTHPMSPSVALSYPNWRDAICDEYNALIKNSTWVLVPKPPNVNVVRSIWLFRHEYQAGGSLSRYKDRFVANGHNQQIGVDCYDTFSPIVKPATVRTPPGYANRVGFSLSHCDSSLFIYQHGSKVAYLLINVDDIIQTASSTGFIQRISSTRDSTGMFMSQKRYALELLNKAHMANCNPTRTLIDTKSKLCSDGDPISDPTLYRSLVGGLQYFTFTHPDISYAVKHVCLHMHDPQEPHLAALKRVL
ncbi:ribonuclease H-like domain-containing protein [Tanacetum coccineum]